MKGINIGQITGDGVGLMCKEMVRRAIVAIREERFSFEKEDKVGYSGNLDDVVSSADKAAQAIYVKLIRENFPGIGIVAEEDNLREPCTIEGVDAYFTVDPLDGTKAFVRAQSHGIGTMLSLVINGEVAAAFIGDINTQEIYYFRPNSEMVHRLDRFEKSQVLIPPTKNSLRDQYALLRSHPSVYHPVIQKMVDITSDEAVVKDIEITGGSIGISMARLWKQEIGIAVLKAGACTPWDWAPVYGITNKLGYSFFRPLGTSEMSGLIKYDPVLSPEIQQIDHDIVVVHERYLSELPIFHRTGI